MPTVKGLLQLTRAHTVPLEAVPAILGAALATGTLWSVDVALWGMFGVLYHLAGYAHNSLADWQNGYDKDDEYKQHHPLNTGALSQVVAEVTVYVLLFACIIYAVVLAYDSTLGKVVLFGGVATGLLYNTIGKLTEFKFIFIAIAHSTVFVVPYLALGGRITSTALILGLTYMLFWVVFQISVSGEVMGITQDDEENFLVKMGADIYLKSEYTGDYIKFGQYVKQYAYGVKLFNLLAGLLLAIKLQSGYEVIALIIMLGIAQFSLVARLIRSGYYFRQSKVRAVSGIEMTTLFIMVIALSGVISLRGQLLIIGASVLWVLLGNTYLWGTYIGPKV